MPKKFAILPCNGLDKCAGGVTREIALCLVEQTESEIICPVFYRVADARYSSLAQENPLLILDGCATRCASKLAAEKGLKIAERLNVNDLAKERNVILGMELALNEEALSLADAAVDRLLTEGAVASELPLSPPTSDSECFFPSALNYEIYRREKFVFRLPTDEGFFFNENDVWAYVSGNRARIGITDYVQKSLSDILFFTPPRVGAEIDQFDELGAIESGKAVFEIISPVSGIVTAINNKLSDAPEMLNQNPYEQGWIAEIELTNFAEDRELLQLFSGYFPIMKRKVDESRIKS